MTKNAVEEFLEMKKTAATNFGGMAKSFGSHAGMAATGALAAGAGAAMAAGIGSAVSKILDAATKSHDFKSMLENNQDLHEHYQADPKKFNLMFSTLRTMNPTFSKDPLVAGAYMRQMVMSPNGLAGFAENMLSSNKDTHHPIQEAFTGGAEGGARSGLGESYKQDEANNFEEHTESSDESTPNSRRVSVKYRQPR